MRKKFDALMQVLTFWILGKTIINSDEGFWI